MVRTRPLPGTSPSVSEIGFGCARLASLSNAASAREAANTIAAALGCGINLFDTADSYGQGRCEEILGEALGRDRHRAVIVTKAGYRLTGAACAASGLKRWIAPLLRRAAPVRRFLQKKAGAQRRQDFAAEYLTGAIDASLRRLKTDYIDVFLLHSPPVEVIRAGEWVESLQRARANGKIRSFGVSCRESGDLATCVSNPHVAVAQIPCSLIDRPVQGQLEAAAARGLGIIGRQPLASGLLAKPVDRLSPQDFPFGLEEFEELVRRVRAIGGDRHSAESCVRQALEYAVGLNGLASVVLGVSNRHHLYRNLSAMGATPGAYAGTGKA